MVALSSFDKLTHAEKWVYVRTHQNTLVGRLLIGVHSTGVYCLPTCTAREPKAENVRFYTSEADAQAAGLRPCRRCRPDYFYRDYDPDLERLSTLIDALRRDPANFAGLEAMATASGIGVTKLHTLFRQHYHTTPAAYLARTRLAAARQMLADPGRQVIEVAYAAGYESLSAFHHNFRKAMGLSPGDFQRLGKDTSFTIALPGNYVSWVPLKLLGRDPESCIERVTGQNAVKALHIGANTVLLHMEWRAGQVRCRVEAAHPLDTASMQQVHAAALSMLGYQANPAGFERLVAGRADLTRLIEGRHGLRIPLFADSFEGITWAIIGQQVNLAFAYRLRRHLAALCGQPTGQGLQAHPTPQAVAGLDYADLTQRQFSRSKAEYLIDTARLLVSGELALNPFDAASQAEKRLRAVRGFGPWATNYVLMRALGYSDCVPLGDTGLSTALQRYYQLERRPNARETADLLRSFSPYRSLATYHLWLSLGDEPV